MATQASGDKNGTPTSLLLSIVSTIVVFALAEIQNSFLVSEAFSMRAVLMSYVVLGLTLAFFWKRLENNPFLKVSAALYLFGLWVSLFITTLAPVLLAGEYPLVQRTFLQQFGLVFVTLSGVSLIIALLHKQKMNPGLVLSTLGALGLLVTSGGSILFKSRQHSDDLLTSLSHSGKKEAAASEKSHGDSDSGHDDGEEISAQSVGHKLAAHDAVDADGHDDHAAPADAHASASTPDAHGKAKEKDDHAADTHAKDEHAPKADHGKTAVDAHGSAHDAPEAKGHVAPAPTKATHGHNESHAPQGKAVGGKASKAKSLKLSAKALADDHEQDDHGSPKPSKAAPSANDKEEVDAHGASPKPSVKKVKTASLDHATPSTGSGSAKAGQDPHWSYAGGEASPEHWGDLADKFRTCSVGQQQSPIDLPTSWPLLDDISLDYKLTTISIVDNGHGIVFNVGDQNYATIAGKRYKLLQFHVHTPSEHSIDGHLSPMEIHFVHKDERNRLAVIGVMIEAGAEQKTLGDLWAYVPQGINSSSSPRDKVFNIASILPSKLKVYRYRGSLTTPPCSENVLWSVASEKTSLSPAQIEAFKNRYKNNARPVQKRSALVK